MYVAYERVIVEAAVQTSANLTEAKMTLASHVELQAERGHIRYTMDNTTSPGVGENDQTYGMLLLTTEHPKLFTIEDLRRIRFCRNTSGVNPILHLHYIDGREI